MKSPKLSESSAANFAANDKLCNGGNNNNGELNSVKLDHGGIGRTFQCIILSEELTVTTAFYPDITKSEHILD